MIEPARSAVGSLGSGERDGLPSQASGPRLPVVSTLDEPPVVEPGHARATPDWEPCACGGVIFPGQGEGTEHAVVRHFDEVRHLKWYIARLEREVAARPDPIVQLDRPGRLYE